MDISKDLNPSFIPINYCSSNDQDDMSSVQLQNFKSPNDSLSLIEFSDQPTIPMDTTLYNDDNSSFDQLSTLNEGEADTELWKKENATVKSIYHKKALEEKRKHMIKHPDYKYCPKPKQKKIKKIQPKQKKKKTIYSTSLATSNDDLLIKKEDKKKYSSGSKRSMSFLNISDIDDDVNDVDFEPIQKKSRKLVPFKTERKGRNGLYNNTEDQNSPPTVASKLSFSDSNIENRSSSLPDHHGTLKAMMNKNVTSEFTPTPFDILLLNKVEDGKKLDLLFDVSNYEKSSFEDANLSPDCNENADGFNNDADLSELEELKADPAIESPTTAAVNVINEVSFEEKDLIDFDPLDPTNFFVEKILSPEISKASLTASDPALLKENKNDTCDSVFNDVAVDCESTNYYSLQFLENSEIAANNYLHLNFNNSATGKHKLGRMSVPHVYKRPLPEMKAFVVNQFYSNYPNNFYVSPVSDSSVKNNFQMSTPVRSYSSPASFLPSPVASPSFSDIKKIADTTKSFSSQKQRVSKEIKSQEMKHNFKDDSKLPKSNGLEQPYEKQVDSLGSMLSVSANSWEVLPSNLEDSLKERVLRPVSPISQIAAINGVQRPPSSNLSSKDNLLSYSIVSSLENDSDFANGVATATASKMLKKRKNFVNKKNLNSKSLNYSKSQGSSVTVNGNSSECQEIKINISDSKKSEISGYFNRDRLHTLLLKSSSSLSTSSEVNNEVLNEVKEGEAGFSGIKLERVNAEGEVDNGSIFKKGFFDLRQDDYVFLKGNVTDSNVKIEPSETKCRTKESISKGDFIFLNFNENNQLGKCNNLIAPVNNLIDNSKLYPTPEIEFYECEKNFELFPSLNGV
ncbi:hypothetical protein HDU92_004553 [Lobulomyces angularis]|nr:hypothetical protein HDU92_004553 [Lobulomyces angularis]